MQKLEVAVTHIFKTEGNEDAVLLKIRGIITSHLIKVFTEKGL